jgi:hypothetical protein
VHPISSVGYTGCVAIQGERSIGRIVTAGGVERERINPDGRIEAAADIVKEHEITANGRVVIACNIVRKRTGTNGCVDVAGSVAKEGVIAGRGVKATFGIAKKGERSAGCVSKAGRIT